MMRSSDGFSLIFLLIILTTIMACITNRWMIMLCNHQVSLQRLSHQQHLNAAQALLDYGVALAKANFDFLLENETNGTTLLFKTWPVYNSCSGQAKLDLIADSSTIKVQAQLSSSTATIDLSCLVIKQIQDAQELFAVQQWTIK